MSYDYEMVIVDTDTPWSAQNRMHTLGAQGWTLRDVHVVHQLNRSDHLVYLFEKRCETSDVSDV